MTAAEIRQRLERHWHDYICLNELRMATGFKVSSRMIDMFLIHPFPSRECERIAVEIKVSRSDFMREIRAPKKRRRARALATYFYFATPVGLVKPKEVPRDCGLIEVGDHAVKTVIPSPMFYGAPDWPFVATLLRHIKGE